MGGNLGLRLILCKCGRELGDPRLRSSEVLIKELQVLQVPPSNNVSILPLRQEGGEKSLKTNPRAPPQPAMINVHSIHMLGRFARCRATTCSWESESFESEKVAEGDQQRRLLLEA